MNNNKINKAKRLHDLVIEEKRKRLDKNKLDDYIYSYLNKELTKDYRYYES